MPPRSLSTVPLDTQWRFSRIDEPHAENWDPAPTVARVCADGYRPSESSVVDVPHTVARLGWQQWDKREWEHVWLYQREFDLRRDENDRVLIHFEAVMHTATVVVNGQLVGTNYGGYLPFVFDVTDHLRDGENTLAVIVDSRFNVNVPPNIPIPVESEAVDYWQPGGIVGRVWLESVPLTYVLDVSTQQHEVLSAQRSLEVEVELDSREVAPADVTAELLDTSGAVLASAGLRVDVAPGVTVARVKVSDLSGIALWDVEDPTLYTLVVSVTVDDSRHSTARRIGFREARFEKDGFYLNGRRLYLFGANRHQHYPYAGFAMAGRAQRKDAEILRRDLNCNMVRCSHYPQSSAFLDACDELGLLVWEESPGWQYLGDEVWRARAQSDIERMVRRDRNRPSVIVWGARLNETSDHQEFYSGTEAMVKALDPSRATSGTMFGPYYSSNDFQHDVFSYDDYTIVEDEQGDRRPQLLPPRTEWPYLIGETVTSWSSPLRLYRRRDGALLQQHQAVDYAHVHDQARSDPRYTGVLAWSGFDYHAGHRINSRGVKTSGLVDVFRVRKPGSAMYMAQIDPRQRVVLEPAFTWDPPVAEQRGAYSDNRTWQEWGPGARAVVFSNCDRIDVFVDAEYRGSYTPDRETFPHLTVPPTFVDLSDLGPAADLRLDGFIDEERVTSRKFSGNRQRDRLVAAADDARITADGVDTTRVEFAVADCYGNYRGTSEARVSIRLEGPGVLLGEPTLDLGETGAVGAVWVRSQAESEGLITVHVEHEDFGHAAAMVKSRSE